MLKLICVAKHESWDFLSRSFHYSVGITKTLGAEPTFMTVDAETFFAMKTGEEYDVGFTDLGPISKQR